MLAATGTASEEFGRLLLSQTISAFSKSSSDLICNTQAVHEALLAMAPADEHEGVLCSRLLVLHNHSMDYMQRSISSNHEATIDFNINRVTKLTRLYNETLDMLLKYRRKGEQKVTVQHVNVNNGGQAIVAGEIAQGGNNLQKERV